MRRLLLIVPLVLLLAAGGGAFFFYFGSADAAVEPTKPVEAPPGEFVQFETISLPIFREGRIKGRIAFSIVVEVPPGEDHRRLLAATRRLEDAFNTELAMLLGLQWPGDVPVDLDVARRRLLERARRVPGLEGISGVLFRSVQERRS